MQIVANIMDGDLNSQQDLNDIKIFAIEIK